MFYYALNLPDIFFLIYRISGFLPIWNINPSKRRKNNRMEWWHVLTIILGGLMVLLATGMPVAFCFMVVNIIGVYYLWDGVSGFYQLADSIFSSVSTFSLLPVPLFVIMGEVLFHSQLALKAIDVVDKWLGRIPGRLGVLALASGTMFSCLSGSSIGSASVLRPAKPCAACSRKTASRRSEISAAYARTEPCVSTS